MEDLLSADGVSRSKVVQPSVEGVLTAAEDERYDGGQSRCVRYHLRSGQDPPSENG